MIVLDTNVVSELMRPAPAARVLGWIDSQSASQLFITAITQAEILTGVMQLPRGKRREAIAAAAGEMFERDFAGRILAFDSSAAEAHAAIASARRRAGRPIAAFDAQIAAIARTHDAALATRNVGDFAGCGLEIIDPWSG
jgi:predicted nucleic acid-binding protein